MFSGKFKNKAVRAKQKSLDATFNNLGNKIKELKLDPVKEQTIIEILDESYTEKHIELMTAASKGEIKETPKAAPVVTAEPAGDADLAAALGGTPAPAPETAAPKATGGKGGSKKK